MVRHSQAILAWEHIFATFPFNRCIQSREVRTTYILKSVAAVFMYFKDLSQTKTPIGMKNVAKIWFELLTHVPEDVRVRVPSYGVVSEYFIQALTYTPLDIHTVRPL